MSSACPIAVVGLGGRFPMGPARPSGSASGSHGASDGAPEGASATCGPEALWRLVEAGRSATREVPPGRWVLPPQIALDSDGVGPTPTPDRVRSARACFLDETPGDLQGVGLPAGLSDLTAALDPMFRVGLAAARDAWESCVREGVDPRRVEVILGNIALPTETTSKLAWEIFGGELRARTLGEAARGPGPGVHPLNRFVTGLPAGLIAWALGLSGNVFTLDAACASSLFAVAAACEALRARRADAVLTGGIGRPDSLYTHMGFSQLGALSATGRCAPFDRAGNGLLLGEGAGVFVLKRLDDALAAGDRIRGIVRGVGLSNDRDGRLLSPSDEGQRRAMAAAYTAAGFAPGSVDLIECHATGTPVGDATELRSLHGLWAGEPARPGQCVLGSVKSNVGHLLTGAGAAGMMKALLALEARTLPPTANFERGLPQLEAAGSPFRVLKAAEPWEAPAGGGPRRAAVSAFGFGGTNAHLLLERWEGDAHPPVVPAAAATTTAATAPGAGPVPIAIVGIGGAFGPWQDPDALRDRLLGPAAAEAPSRDPSPHRWHEAGVDRPGHYLEAITLALGRFRIPPTELRQMLPQQLLMLLAATDAFDDASLNPAADAGDLGADRDEDGDDRDRLATGAFIGLSLDLTTTQYHARWAALALARDPAQAAPWKAALSVDDPELLGEKLADTMGPALSPDRTMGSLGGIVASRIARELRLGGPCFTLSSEESSGLTAIEAAIRALRAGQIDRALAGAVDLPGDIRALAEGAPGEVPLIGEGACAFVLRRLDDALAAGERVHAIIEGVGSARSGACGSTRGGPPAEADAFSRAAKSALAEAEAAHGATIDLASVGLLDFSRAHLAAPAREALLDAWRSPDPEHLLAFGTAARAVGDAGAASGMAGLLRVVLALRHQVLPGEYATAQSAGAKATLAAPFLADPQVGPRRAVVSAHSVDGKCVQLLLREARQDGQEQPIETPPGSRRRARPPLRAHLARESLLLLSAPDRPGLALALRDLAQQLSTAPLEALARDAHAREREAPGRLGLSLLARDAGEAHRLAALALASLEDAGEAGHALERDLALGSRGRIALCFSPLGREGALAFVYPGSGNHFPGMGRWAGLRFPEAFSAAPGENSDDAEKLGRVTRQLLPGLSWRSDLATMHANPSGLIRAQVALGIAMTALTRRLGLAPSHALGYSLGETTALFSLGAWRDRALMAERMHSSDLFKTQLCGPCDAARIAFGLPDGAGPLRWSMAVVRRPAEALRKPLAAEPRVFLLIVNTRDECVIGGEAQAVARFAQAQGLELHPVQGVTTVHCPVVEPVAKAYRELHLLPTTAPPGVRFYSGASGQAYAPDTHGAADAILAQALHGIDFPATVESAYAGGARLFVEIGPGASCTRMIGEILGPRAHRAVALQVAAQDPERTLLRALALLHAHRVPVDLSPFFEAAHAPDPTEVDAQGSLEDAPAHPALTLPVGLPVGLPPPEAPRPATAPEAPRQASRATPVAAPAALSLHRPAPEPAVLASPGQVSLEAHARPELLADGPGPLVAGLREASARRAEAHRLFLTGAQANLRTLASGFAQLAARGELPPRRASDSQSTVTAPASILRPPQPTPGTRPEALSRTPPRTVPRALDHAQCVAFATGRIGDVLGARFAHVDAHPTRVRLPEGPLMLVDRIPEIDAEAGSMRPGRIITEHTVHADRWYLDAGRIPTGVCVESGQADLFLAAYLGIDTKTRGLAVYRLLDAKVTFHRPLPKVGETLRHEIRILELFEQAGTFFFRFEYDSTVDGDPQLTMREGLAGFFTAEALAAGEGLKASRLERAARTRRPPTDHPQLAPPMQDEAYDTAALTALRRGELAAAFGPAFEALSLADPTRLPGGHLALIDAVTACDEAGGWYGRGLIRATQRIAPDAWFLICHFVDDPVMPGTLMYESALQALRVFVMRRGWVGEQEAVVFEPIPGVESVLACRGQVIGTTREVVYELHVKTLGFAPAGSTTEAGTPQVTADVIMLADGRPIVQITDMSLQASGLSRARLEALWSHAQKPASPPAATAFDRPARYGPEKIRAYAEGRPSDAFGAPYRVFDSGRRIARLPRAPYLFLDRVTHVEGRPFAFEAGARVDAEVAIRPDAWFFRDDGQQTLPFAVLLEIALQPCGWLAAYVGSALQSETDLHFRNLGGEGRLFAQVERDAGLLLTHTELADLSKSGDTIIQHFRFEVATPTQTVYAGTTYFGFFTGEALGTQVGLRGATLHPLPSPPTPIPCARGGALPTGRLAMLDALDHLSLEGGPHGHGLVQGSKQIDPAEWFFEAHFYQDPVWPGSLGVEAFLHLLRAYGARRFGASRFVLPKEASAHRWTYRGQVIPEDRAVIVQAAITSVDEAARTLRADGFLAVDGRVIYEMKDFGLACA